MASKNDYPPQLRPFMAEFEVLLRRNDAGSIFADWLKATFAAFGHGAMEALYEEAVRRYDASERERFARMTTEYFKLLAEYVIEMDSWHDPLGIIYESILSSYKASGMGQFFTPEAVCTFTAQITGSKPRGIVCDPACGSGRQLLAHHAAHRLDRCYYVGQDLDQMCVHMTALNLVMHGARGEVHWMNTLTMEHFGSWIINPYLEDLGIPGIMPVPVHHSYLGGGRPPFFEAYRRDQTPDAPIVPEIQQPAYMPGQQLTLF